MKTIALIALLLVSLPARATETILYNTVISIASSGADVDFSGYRYLKPILQLSYRHQRELPPDASITIHARPNPITLTADALGAVIWPVRPDLRAANPRVTSVPDELQARGQLRISAAPTDALQFETFAAMRAEYVRFLGNLPLLKRLTAPRPKGLLVVVAGELTATVNGRRHTPVEDRIQIPIDELVGPVTFSRVPEIILLDLGLE